MPPAGTIPAVLFVRRFAFPFVVCVVIVHGSLYPYEFQIPYGGPGPLGALIASWASPPSSLGDLIANLLLYTPLGFAAAFLLNDDRRIWIIPIFGMALSTSVEVLQYYDAGRVTNASDIYLNTIGTVFGAGLALLAKKTQSHRIRLKLEPRDPIAGLLLLAMFSSKLYPYVPTIDVHKYWHALKPVLTHPNLSTYALLQHLSLWLAASYLMAQAIGPTLSRSGILLFAALMFGAKILIVNQSLSCADLAGAALAITLWLLVLQHRAWAAVAVAGVLAVSIIVERLAPFHFAVRPSPFQWMPFLALLQGSLAANIQAFLGKIFLYGSLIWIANAAGLRLWLAASITASVLFLTSIAETHLPGRSAEITDALMALMLGAGLAAIRQRTDTSPHRGGGESLFFRQPV